MKREVALKGDAFALTELLSRITEMASTVTLMGALAGKVRDPIQSEYGAMALRLASSRRQNIGVFMLQGTDREIMLQLA